jgi:glyoxylase-like metal-dependent hydrolase (beta-lactamase superfamily II)
VFGQPHVRTSVAARLRELGVHVRAIVMTHLHWDHAGGLVDLPGVPVLVSAAEWRSAQRPAGALRGYLRRQLAMPERVALLSFSTPGAQPLGGFERTLDLFGDGSVVLLATHGHSSGHLSVLLRLHDRLLLWAADALLTMRILREDLHPAFRGRRRAYERSVGAIRRFAQTHPGALVLPGHDLDAWEASGIEGTG